MKSPRGAMLGLLNAAILAAPAPAGEAPASGADIPEDAYVSSRGSLIESTSEKDHLLGDWAGARTRLVERGIHFQAGYIGEVMGNLSGGLKRGAVYEGLFETGVTLDLEKLTGVWRGGFVRTSLLYPHGKSASGELLGDLQTASNIDAYDSVALYEWWFEQRCWQDRVSLRLGQQLVDQEFTTTASGALFLNSSFGWPAFISGNTLNTGPAYYRAALGALLWMEPVKDFYLQAGVFDGDTFDDRAGSPKKNPHGTNLRLSSEQGAFAIAEAGVRLNHEKDARALPGTYKIGGWLHTAEFEDVLNPSHQHGENFGVYLAIEQNVWREAKNDEGFDQGLSAFFRAGLSPADRNLFSFTFDTGINYTGLIPGRDEDTFGLGVAFVRISEDVRGAERAAGTGINSDYELALEVTYEFLLTSWWSVQPDFQWIRHPGGSRALDDAFVLGLRTRITF